MYKYRKAFKESYTLIESHVHCTYTVKTTLNSKKKVELSDRKIEKFNIINNGEQSSQSL